jgi:hypothetical protein
MSESDADPWEGECPYCDKSTGHLNNHIRPTDGAGHGPAGQYPSDWDPDAKRLVEPDDGGDEQGGDGGDGVTIDPQGDDEDDGEDLATLTVETGGESPRTYECPECEIEVAYGADECDEGHEQEWF